MSRTELEKKAFNEIRNNMEFISFTDEQIREEISKATNSQIYSFLEELEG